MSSADAVKHTKCPLSWSQPGGPFPCLGSGCQLWRLEVGYFDAGGNRVKDPDRLPLVGASLSDFRRAYTDLGGCGLAGEGRL